jgi:phage terminase large subunit-like protein
VYHDAEIDRVVRVIRSAWVEIPRKNGKSTLSSGISGVLLLADGEAGAEVYNAAGSTLQAGRVFEDAKRMLLASPSARKRVNALKEVVEVPRTGGILRVLSRVAETAHGLNVSGAVIDEIHTMRLRRALVEAIETGVGARDQPLIVFITTADEAEEGTIYDEKHLYTRNIANRVVSDTRHFGVIWAAESTDDPFAEATWAKANPGAGKSPTWSYLRGESLKAQNQPTYLPTFLRLSLNLRTRDQSAWFDLNDWDACAKGAGRAALRKKRAWGGLDLSAVSDFTAWTVFAESVKPGFELELTTRLWVPAERVFDLEKKLQVPLQQWIDQGHVDTTEGDVIDYAAIQAAVIGDCQHFDMQRVSYDRMFAGQLVQELDTALRGVDVLPVAQTFAGLSPACKEWERLAKSQAFCHSGNPALRWMASVVEVKHDGLDNIRPVKPDRRKASARIDGIQAGVTALDGWVRRPKAAAKRRVVVGRG